MDMPMMILFLFTYATSQLKFNNVLVIWEYLVGISHEIHVTRRNMWVAAIKKKTFNFHNAIQWNINAARDWSLHMNTKRKSAPQ